MNAVPSREGYYWATDRVNGLRQIVRVGKDGFGHARVFTTWYRVKNMLDFTDWSRPIRERKVVAR